MPNFKILFLVLICTWFSFAQQNTPVVQMDTTTISVQEISEKHLEKYKQDKRFNYKEHLDDNSWFKKLKRWAINSLLKILEFIFGVGKASGILSYILMVIPYLLLLVLIFILIKLFVNVNSKALIFGEQEKAAVVFSNEEQLIKNEDLNELILNAVKQNDFRLAIRYYYLLSLKSLTNKELIDWQQDKTNEDYINEIKRDDVKSQFEKITRIYDYVWYGEFDVDAIKFEHLKLDFITLNQSVN
jgi:hypothetical protein